MPFYLSFLVILIMKGEGLNFKQNILWNNKTMSYKALRTALAFIREHTVIFRHPMQQFQ